MTARSKKDKRSAPKADKRALDASVETINEAQLEASTHAVREAALDISTKAISHDPFEVAADAVSEDARGASASEDAPSASVVTMSFDRPPASELDEKVLTPSTKSDKQESTVLQNLFLEWFEFAGMRLSQHVHLIQTLQDCRSLPDLQQAYSQFWQNAYTQYGEETQRMLRMTRGAVDHAARAAHEGSAPQATLH